MARNTGTNEYIAMRSRTTSDHRQLLFQSLEALSGREVSLSEIAEARKISVQKVFEVFEPDLCFD
jgi:DNA-directed RNA polymerase specialized sigma subunit